MQAFGATEDGVEFGPIRVQPEAASKDVGEDVGQDHGHRIGGDQDRAILSPCLGVRHARDRWMRGGWIPLNVNDIVSRSLCTGNDSDRRDLPQGRI